MLPGNCAHASPSHAATIGVTDSSSFPLTSFNYVKLHLMTPFPIAVSWRLLPLAPSIAPLIPTYFSLPAPLGTHAQNMHLLPPLLLFGG